MEEQTQSPAVEAGNDDAVFVFPEREAQIEHYETLILVPGTATEEEAAAVFEAAKAELANFGATITSEEAWGRKQLAYTVAKSRHGYYFVVEFDMDKSNVADFNNKLQLRKDVARFMTVKKRLKTEEELAEEKRIREKVALKQHQAAEEAAAEEAQMEAEAVAKRKVAAEAAAAKAEAKKKAATEEATEEKAEEVKEEAPAAEETTEEVTEEVTEEASKVEEKAEVKSEEKKEDAKLDIESEIDKVLEKDLDA